MKQKKFWRWFSWSLIAIVILAAGAGAYYHYQYLPNHPQATKKVALNEQQAEETFSQNKQNQKNYPSRFDHDVPSKLTKADTKKIAGILNRSQFVGTALIVRNNKIIYQRGFGYADKAAGRKNNAKSLFQIASIQKSMTATLLMQLVDEGKVKFSDPISKYYPSIPHGNKITIRMMLDMHSGLFPGKAPTTMLTDKELVKYAVKHIKVHSINLHSYQPINYTLLSGIIERKTGKTYHDLIQTEFLDPLHLGHTGFMDTFDKEKDRTRAYEAIDPLNYYKKVQTENYVQYNNQLGTGNVYTSVGDLFKIEQAITQGKIIPKSSVNKLRDTNGGQYGGGVYNFTDYFSSHGVEGGYDSGLTLSKDGENGVVLLSNHKPLTTTMILSQQLYQIMLNETK
ncbi:serine hydrolase domain-containing protein [Lactobacillus selangorensis]|nr:serine hydrolase domain-containing protein [Lactobacillus selangorensis]